MRILHLIPSLSPLRGGPSQAILDMVQAQRQQGLQSEIVTTDDHGTAVLSVPYGQRVESASIAELSGPSVPVWFFPRVCSFIAPLREFAIAPALVPWLWHHLPTYDLVHVHAIFNFPTTVGMAIARHHHIPYIVRPLGSLCQWSLQQGRLKKQGYLKLGGDRLLKHSARLHFTSEQEQQEAWEQGFRSPSFVLPHGVTMSPPVPDARRQLRETLGLAIDEPVLLFMSRLHPKKGLEVLLEAIAQLAHQRFHLVIAGQGNPLYEAQLEQHISAKGIGRRVHQVGFVTGADKDRLLQGADLFVLPSYSENFGLVLMEAMAAGLPVMTTPNVAIAPLIQESQTGWVVALEAQAIAKKLELCLQNPTCLQEAGQRGRKLVQNHYSWFAQAMQLIQHYQHSCHSSETVDFAYAQCAQNQEV